MNANLTSPVQGEELLSALPNRHSLPDLSELYLSPHTIGRNAGRTVVAELATGRIVGVLASSDGLPPASALEQLAGKQALEIAGLTESLADCKKDMAEISMILCCIGGALNDNVLGFSAEQRKPLHRINNLAERWIE